MMASRRTFQRAWTPQPTITVPAPLYSPPPEFKCKLVVAPHKHGLSPKLHTVPARRIVDSWSSTGETQVNTRLWKDNYGRSTFKPRRNVSDIYRAFKVILVLSAIAFWLFGVGAGPVIKCAAGESCEEAKASFTRIIINRARNTIAGASNQLNSDSSFLYGVPIGEVVSTPAQPELSKNPFERVKDWSTIVAYLCGTVLIIAFAIETLIWELSAVLHTIVCAPSTIVNLLWGPYQFSKRKIFG